jgi:hypothetical protein
MGHCIHHPERETPYRCHKYDLYLCEACLVCRDPTLYCKHRSACAIAFMEKERGREAAAAGPLQTVECADADGARPRHIGCDPGQPPPVFNDRQR